MGRNGPSPSAKLKSSRRPPSRFRNPTAGAEGAVGAAQPSAKTTSATWNRPQASTGWGEAWMWNERDADWGGGWSTTTQATAGWWTGQWQNQWDGQQWTCRVPPPPPPPAKIRSVTSPEREAGQQEQTESKLATPGSSQDQAMPVLHSTSTGSAATGSVTPGSTLHTVKEELPNSDDESGESTGGTDPGAAAQPPITASGQHHVGLDQLPHSSTSAMETEDAREPSCHTGTQPLRLVALAPQATGHAPSATTCADNFTDDEVRHLEQPGPQGLLLQQLPRQVKEEPLDSDTQSSSSEASPSRIDEAGPKQVASQTQVAEPMPLVSTTMVSPLQTAASSDTSTDEHIEETTPLAHTRQSSSDIEGVDTSLCPVVRTTWTSDLSPTSPAETTAIPQENVTYQPPPPAEPQVRRSVNKIQGWQTTGTTETSPSPSSDVTILDEPGTAASSSVDAHLATTTRVTNKMQRVHSPHSHMKISLLCNCLSALLLRPQYYSPNPVLSMPDETLIQTALTTDWLGQDQSSRKTALAPLSACADYSLWGKLTRSHAWARWKLVVGTRRVKALRDSAAAVTLSGPEPPRAASGCSGHHPRHYQCSMSTSCFSRFLRVLILASFHPYLALGTSSHASNPARVAVSEPIHSSTAKRSYKRAVKRASRFGVTTYLGRTFTAKQLRTHYQPDNADRGSPSPQAETAAHGLRVLYWNAGGLHASRHAELKHWLHIQDQSTRPDLVVITETRWPTTMEYPATDWQAIHTGAGQSQGGILVLVHNSVCPAHDIRYNELKPGRLLHVRISLQKRPALDVLAVYQHAWNPDGGDGDRQARITRLLANRSDIWERISKWARSAQLPLPVAPRKAGEKQGNSLKELTTIMADAWATALDHPQKLLQRLLTSLRKKQHLDALIMEARNSSSPMTAVHQILKRYAPKVRQKRLQLRTSQGHILTPQEEMQQIVGHFKQVYKQPDHAPSGRPVDQAVVFDPHNVLLAFSKLPNKALPSHFLPAPLWRASAHLATQVFQQTLVAACDREELFLPKAWHEIQVALIPKPSKPATSADSLRPISLLSPMAKVLAKLVAEEIRPIVSKAATRIPQFAYLEGRQTCDAIDRAFGHCREIRERRQNATVTTRERRAGKTAQIVSGGVTLSLDLRKAFDSIPWRCLQQCLEHFRIPASTIQLILYLHENATYIFKTPRAQGSVLAGQGIRQGCGLAPMLWTLYSLYLASKLDTAAPSALKTFFADDFLAQWTIETWSDMKSVPTQISKIVAVLEDHGMQLSPGKTVVLYSLWGTQVHACLKPMLCQHATLGKCLRIGTANLTGKSYLLPVVMSHEYLGVKLSYKNFEWQTLKHRLRHSWIAYNRLSALLKSKALPVHKRLQLHQCICLATLRYGLSCTGLTMAGRQKVYGTVLRQWRALANNLPHITGLSNATFLTNFHLADPLDGLDAILIKRLDKVESGPIAPLQPPVVKRWWEHLRKITNDPTVTQTTSKVPLRHQDARPPAPCDVCGLSFPNEATLRWHISNVHVKLTKEQHHAKEDEAFLQEAQSDDWKQLAQKIRAIGRLHYCPFCNLWMAKTAMLHQHIKAQHVDAAAHLDKCQHFLLTRKGINSPCQHCGTRHNRAAVGCSVLIRVMMDELTRGAAEMDLWKSMMNKPGEVGQKRQGDRVEDLSRQKGRQRGDRGKGNQSFARQAKQASGPSSLDNDEDDPLREAVKLITTLSLRHEDALAIHRQDTSYVFFMKTSPPELTVLSDLMRVGSEWKAKKEQSPALVTQPLRVVLLGCLLEAVTTRMQSLQDPTLHAKAQAAKLVNPAGDFHYMMWDDAEKIYQNKDDRESIPTKTVLEDIATLQRLILQPRVVGRFHAQRKLAPDMQGEVVPFVLEIGLRNQASHEVYFLLDKYCHQAIWHLAGTSLRHDKLGRGALANALEKLAEKL
ncbi:unnamed protein product [Symbiodinium natans]|uniref:Reverse transcriptase domain-containing protein n=1 Tax=Symbiodinium natans TaxID=878477 RepID=A0A812RZK1_9DINO|nr:unnamed protein product [Symbiodinium natans]